ncbi:DUF3710 domain-containing protein [Sporichthya polymorpha]|uniref:DUF3710 domain-containing protein n=1 Tax=Sporichthya polymorpha TaxID=35751 RepID=UPI00037994AA|nr:DUF3710 domain-containing protein [Sporichthya polymorpha]
MAFRRRKKGEPDAGAELDSYTESDEAGAETGTEVDADPGEVDEVLAALGDTPAAEVDQNPSWPVGSIRDRDGGPWDADSAPEDKIERVDLGGVRIPILNGMELRAELAEDQVVAVTLIIERSALQIQPFAAPRTMGIWDEVRGEIAEGIVASGGRSTEEEGRFGTELVAEVGVALPDGTTGLQTARFLGVDGPRWFLRAVITGEAATDASLRRALEDLLADVVVVRGQDAMAPRDPIPLQLPQEVEIGEHGEQFVDEDTDEGDEDGGRRTDDLKPFERGPEITEVR